MVSQQYITKSTPNAKTITNKNSVKLATNVGGLKKSPGVGKLLRQRPDLRAVRTCLLEGLRLEVAELRAEPLLRLLRGSQPLLRPREVFSRLHLSLEAALQLPLQLLVPLSENKILVCNSYAALSWKGATVGLEEGAGDCDRHARSHRRRDFVWKGVFFSLSGCRMPDARGENGWLWRLVSSGIYKRGIRVSTVQVQCTLRTGFVFVLTSSCFFDGSRDKSVVTRSDLMRFVANGDY